MEKELQDLDRHLFDNRRRDGTACVLLHGQPGGGKSHLARQYIHQSRKKFRGGIFWIPAKLREEIEQAFWTIYQKIVVREPLEASGDPAIDATTWVESVKAWFEARHNWLMIFDGMVVDKDEDATALQCFIPDSRNSSIIYISRAKSLESKQRLLRPYPIKVSPLKEDDARKLLFQELHIKKPTEAQIKSAMELVKKIGGLPLAINAISHRLADTNEPLTKFNIKSYSADPKMGGTYNKILDDLKERGHTEAWNLIHILCFFGPHIPMEMVHLGLRALRNQGVDVKTREGDGKPDINTTIGILRRYALIERNEPEDIDSMSSSRDSLVEPEPIDMLKVHSVVQKFCCDSLNGRNDLSQWLSHAVNLFIYSFRQADTKIKQKPDPGRVSDYRYYLVHGRRLRDHSLHYETRAYPLEDVRTELEPVLERIDAEIRVRGPTSSQESSGQGTLQVSIFDRTSSSSESGPSFEAEPRTPDHDRHRPTPLIMAGEDLYGFGAGRPSIDSPASTVASYVNPRIVANIGLLPPYPDDGYESGMENLYHRALEMQKNPSDSTTARPPPPTQPQEIRSDDGESWPMVLPGKKPKVTNPARRPRRDLGSFRPTPASPELDRNAAVGLVARPIQEPGGTFPRRPRSPSDAFAALTEVHHRSSPPPLDGREKSPGQRRLPLQPLSTQQQPTYAGVVAGARIQPASRSSNPNTTATSKISSLLNDALHSSLPPESPSHPLAKAGTGREREGSSHSRGSSGRTNNISRSSPLTLELIPRFENVDANNSQQNLQESYFPLGTNMDATNNPTASRPHSLGPHPNLNHSISHLSDSSRPRYTNEKFNSNYYYAPPPQNPGPNQASLPLEQNITISTTTTTTKAPIPSTFFQAPRHTHPFRTPTSQPSPNLNRAYMPFLPSSYYSPASLPPGYSSQPLSRQQSRQSHPSLPETEPPRPHPSSLSPPQIHAFPSSFLHDRDYRSTSPSLRKQPEHDDDDDRYHHHQRPTFLHLSSSSPHLEDATQTLRGTGSWASPIHPPSTTTELSMSRSSSGPGIRIETFPGEGLGIVRFDDLMQFGEHSPISIEEARRRTDEYERRLLLLMMRDERQRQRRETNEEEERHGIENEKEEGDEEEEEEEEGERRGRARTPYPNFNRIPTMLGVTNGQNGRIDK